MDVNNNFVMERVNYLRRDVILFEMIPQERLVALKKPLELKAERHYTLRACAHPVQFVPVSQVECSKDEVQFDGVFEQITKRSS